jgi:transmembrane sensor
MSGTTFQTGDPTDDPRDVAAGWFARQRSGEMTPHDRLELRAWLEADAAHRAAYASVRQVWGGAALLRGDPAVLEIREQWTKAQKRSFAIRAMAASVAAVVICSGGLLGWWYAEQPRPLRDETFRTAVGERTTIELPDGSELILNTDTVVRTRRDEDRRLVFLEKGQAYFQVAKDTEHPFVVTAAGRTVTALGTAFDVRIDQAGRFEVTLVEGKVRVEAPLAQRAAASAGKAVSFQATELTPGSQLVAAAQEPWRVSAANIVVETSWTKDILIFDDEPLSAVVAELNRYSDKKVTLASAGIAEIPVSGTFRTGDVDSFVRTVEAYRIARAGVDSPAVVELRDY